MKNDILDSLPRCKILERFTLKKNIYNTNITENVKI